MRILPFRLILCEKQVPSSGSSCVRQDYNLSFTLACERISGIAFQASNVVITGVTRGLGRAMVDEFVRLGHKVLGCARTNEDINVLTRKYPGQDFQSVDVASDAAVRAWAKRLLKKHGPPDFVLNNAAVLNLRAPLWEVTDREFSDEIDINIKGVVNALASG